MYTREPLSGIEESRLREALRRLPAAEPPADGWQRLDARLGAAPAPKSGWVPASAVLAAALVVAVGVGLRPDPPPPARGVGAEVGEQQALRARAVELERALAALPEQGVARASTGFTAALLEDEIALVDDRLSSADAERLPPRAAETLLRQRVLLLDSLLRVRYAEVVDTAP